MRIIRSLVGALIVFLAAAVLLSSPARGADESQILGLRLEGVVDPFASSYLTSAIDGAADEGFGAVLVSIDTPGGLSSSMREIISSILNSGLPVICYVAPEGARAASAGAFILTSCNVAAMAPGTNVGAASPVGVSGVVEQRKVLNDSVAYIRSLAELRDRNPDWAEDAVRDARSASAEEALDLNAIDLIASDRDSLLADIDGSSVEIEETVEELDTAGATVVDRDMQLAASLLHDLLTPDLAFIFFYLGLGLIVVEVLHPGISVPGILGALCLIAAFTSFGMLPVQLVGLALLVGSVGFFILEINHPGLSFAAIGGLICLVLGGLLLFDRGTPGAEVSLWAIAPVAGAVALFFAFVIPAVIRTRRLPAPTGADRIIGMHGVATTLIDPRGTARIASESWSVESVAGPILPGGELKVVAADGLRLKVEPLVAEIEPTPAGNKPVEQGGTR